MKRLLIVGVSALTALASAPTVLAFCGFYVAKADTKLFNQASQVVLARHEDKTVLTMANDFKGDPKEFAIVVPVPTLLEKGQIHVGERAVIEHLDAYTAPRLVESSTSTRTRASRACSWRHGRRRLCLYLVTTDSAHIFLGGSSPRASI